MEPGKKTKQNRKTRKRRHTGMFLEGGSPSIPLVDHRAGRSGSPSPGSRRLARPRSRSEMFLLLQANVRRIEPVKTYPLYNIRCRESLIYKLGAAPHILNGELLRTHPALQESYLTFSFNLLSTWRTHFRMLTCSIISGVAWLEVVSSYHRQTSR